MRWFLNSLGEDIFGKSLSQAKGVNQESYDETFNSHFCEDYRHPGFMAGSYHDNHIETSDFSHITVNEYL